MILDRIFSINKDIIEIDYNKDIQLLNKNLVEKLFETNWTIQQLKKHYLVIEIPIAGFKGYVLLVSFSNPHQLVDID